MPVELSNVNYLAVLVAALAIFGIGGLWYSLLFGKQWVRLHGWSDADVAALKQRVPPQVFLGGMLAAYLVQALALAVLIGMLGISNPVAGAKLGILCALGFTVVTAVSSVIASGQRFGLALIDGAFQIVSLAAAGALLAAWR